MGRVIATVTLRIERRNARSVIWPEMLCTGTWRRRSFVACANKRSPFAKAQGILTDEDVFRVVS
jgi:hypothetical protein